MKGTRKLAIAAAWLVGVTAVYVLSIGPAVELTAKGFISEQAYEAIYGPLRPMMNAPIVGGTLTRYIYWWSPERSHRGQHL
jgi:hypothetical protein